MDAAGRRHLQPALLVGQFDGVTVEDVFEFAEIVIRKAADLNKLYSTGQQKLIVDAGMRVLEEIENLPMNAAAQAYIIAASAARTALKQTSSLNAFNKLIPVPVFDQDADSAWALPDSGAIAGPYGYGSAAGFLKLGQAANATKDTAAFARKHGFARELAATAGAFVDFVKDVVTVLRSMMPMNLALDPAAAAPWWTSASPLHTFWDNVVVAHARFPFMLEATSRANLSRRGTEADGLFASLRTRSVQSTKYLQRHLLGNIAVVDGRLDGAAAAPLINIQDSINIGPGTSAQSFQLRYSSQQGAASATPATNISQIYDMLPKFAQEALGGASALGATGQVTRRPGVGVVQQAFNVLLSLVYGTISSLDGATAREEARALILMIINMVRIDAANPSITAARILRVYDALIRPALGDAADLGNRSEAETNAALAAAKPTLVAGATVARLNELRESLSFKTDDDRVAFVNAVKQVASEQSGGADRIYAATPLVYSPGQLASFEDYSGSAVGLADVLVPAIAMTTADVERYAGVISSGSFGQLPSPLRPLNAPAAGIQISYLQRLMQAASITPGADSTITATSSMDSTGYGAAASAVGASEDLGTVVPLSQRKKRPAGEAPTTAAAADAKRSNTFPGPFAHVYDAVSELVSVPAFASKWEGIELQAGRGLLNQWIAKTYMLAANNAKVLKEWARQQLPVHVSALLFRWIRLGTYSIIKVGWQLLFSVLGSPVLTFGVCDFRCLRASPPVTPSGATACLPGATTRSIGCTFPR